jgi:hypothetical protein
MWRLDGVGRVAGFSCAWPQASEGQDLLLSNRALRCYQGTMAVLHEHLGLFYSSQDFSVVTKGFWSYAFLVKVVFCGGEGGTL